MVKGKPRVIQRHMTKLCGVALQGDIRYIMFGKKLFENVCDGEEINNHCS